MKIQKKKMQDFIQLLKIKEEEHFNQQLCTKCRFSNDLVTLPSAMKTGFNERRAEISYFK